jgi:hypothetical protein
MIECAFFCVAVGCVVVGGVVRWRVVGGSGFAP